MTEQTHIWNRQHINWLIGIYELLLKLQVMEEIHFVDFLKRNLVVGMMTNKDRYTVYLSDGRYMEFTR